MKKKRLLKFLLVGGLMITSVAISLSSCKKNNEASEDLESLPTVEMVIGDEGRDPIGYLICPYCQQPIYSGEFHEHHFSPLYGENTLPSHPSYLTWGSMTYVNELGETVPNIYGDIVHPFPVDYCQSYWNVIIPPGQFICRYCFEKIYHRHIVTYSLEANLYDGYTQNKWHVGAGIVGD